jgi:hypothetical protein
MTAGDTLILAMLGRPDGPARNVFVSVNRASAPVAS